MGGKRTLDRQVAGDLGLEKANQGFVHELIVVGNVEADDTGLEVPFEAFLKPVPVRFLHHEDRVRPGDEFGRRRVLRVVVEPGRGDLDAFMRREDLLRRGAAKPVLAAQEQDLLHRFSWHERPNGRNGWHADRKGTMLRAKGNDMPTSRPLGALLVCGAIWAPSPAHAQGAAPPAAPPSPTDEITVVGARPERAETSIPLGSRIAREPLPTFNAVASTNVAGLTPGSGMDPFAGGTRFVSETICRSDNPRLSADAACRLLPIQR